MLLPRVPSVGVAVLTALLCGATAAPAANSSHGPLSPSAAIDGVVIAGGYYKVETLANVEVLDMESLPWMPIDVYEHTLTAVGPVLYSCGGRNAHTAVRVSSHIWFMYDDKVHDLDTLTGKFLSYETPFSFCCYHCAVSNSTHSYVLGVGENYTEIWVNTRDYSPASWQLVHVMTTPMRYFDCLWYQQTIFLTGGRNTQTRSVVLDIPSSKMHSTNKLSIARWAHRMGTFDNKPAVFGGFNSNINEQLTSIETFETSTESWTVVNRTLTQARSWFGLAQPTY